MESTILKLTIAALIISSPMSVIAAEPIQESEVSNNPIHAITHLPITGVKIATGAVAIPLMIVGEIGNISSQAGKELWLHASRPINKPNHSADTNTPVNSKERFL
jgi:hypothetical protein